MTFDPKVITRYVLAEYRLDPAGIHGPAHWLRVRQNGLALARRTPTDHLAAPGGSLTRLMAAFAPLTRERAALLAGVLDPCVPVTVKEWADA